MEFLDRREELALIKKLNQGNFFLVVKGRRRIGKTTFLKEGLSNAVYIFIWPNKSVDWILEEICREYSLPAFKTFKDLILYLIKENKTIVIDEFQNFMNVDKSVYGEIQKIVDENKHKFLKISVAGSSYSLINKVFNDTAAPLYGRRSGEITLTHLPIQVLFNYLKRSLEDFIKLWAVFQGVPYYYEVIDSDNAENNLKRLFFLKNSFLREEGKAILSIEFGGQSKTYSTVLSAISEGKTKLNEISGYFGNRKSETIKYLDLLRKEFNLVKRLTPVLSDPRKSREGIYEINDNLLDFWFFFIDKQRIYIEQDRENELLDFFEKNFNSYIGKCFEKFIIELIKNKLVLNKYNFTKFGKQWGNSKEGPYEIDILCVEKNKLVVCECKWTDKLDAEKIFEEMEKKITYFETDKKEIEYVIFAKTFNKKISSYKNRKVKCIDLKEIQKLLK